MITKTPLRAALQATHYPQLKITKCSDSKMWYASMVGKTVSYLREIDEGFLSWEPSGYVNIILKDDVELIPLTAEVAQCI
jgi:hypothetical protein